MAYQTLNPYTGEVLATFNDATDAEVESALEKGHQAFLQWKNTSFKERAKILNNAAEILNKDINKYAQLLTLEMGKLLREARSEVELSAKILQYYVKNAEKHLQPEKLAVGKDAIEEAYLVHEPLGILLSVEPWNFPYYQVARMLAPQLCAGNAVILKHASNVPQAAAAFEKLMLDAGLPEGVFQNLYLTHKQINTVINDRRVCGVALTGSETAGKIVASEAGLAMKKSTLELGGADAFIVLKDADIDKTVEWAVFGRHWNAGQVCVSAKRMIIADEIYDEFIEKYRKGVAKLVAGNPMSPDTTLAPLSSQKAVDDLKKLIEEAKEEGITVTEDGAPVPETGAFMRPTILTDIPEGVSTRYKEFFGPVSMIFRAKDEDDAIRIANDTPFGLGGSIFTRDVERAKYLAKRIVTGMVYINHPTKVEPDLPFGGVGHSGYGRELTVLGLKEFVNHKLIAVTDINSPF
ncbi:NAD-dependent succinate-semialdehyde dehydrogenase [Acetobacteraceae bacterium]|nr:NAD-dependent succinate-semialdehyde dehydrogenase [Acetobacteraceae bacterium]